MFHLGTTAINSMQHAALFRTYKLLGTKLRRTRRLCLLTRPRPDRPRVRLFTSHSLWLGNTVGEGKLLWRLMELDDVKVQKVEQIPPGLACAVLHAEVHDTLLITYPAAPHRTAWALT